MSEIKIAFWNLQNLFDTTESELAADLEFTPAEGWDEEAYEAKVDNLSQVIRLMDNDKGPDLLGICEIETREVAEDLMQRCNRPDYALAHIDSPDIRGIDTSLIYSTNVFELMEDPIAHLVHLRHPTRDIFQVKLRVIENNAELSVLVNHWPSRSAGQLVTEPYRITTASSCGYIIDRILKYPRKEYLQMEDTQETLDKLNERWNKNVLFMGDFNDEPFNTSILNELKASSGEDLLEEPIKPPKNGFKPSPEAYLEKKACLFNCMWPFAGEKDRGSYFYYGSTNTMNVLDQFIISRGLYYDNLNTGLKMNLESVDIFDKNIMATKVKNRPIRFDKKKKKGFSDHFPIVATITTT